MASWCGVLGFQGGGYLNPVGRVSIDSTWESTSTIGAQKIKALEVIAQDSYRFDHGIPTAICAADRPHGAAISRSL